MACHRPNHAASDYGPSLAAVGSEEGSLSDVTPVPMRGAEEAPVSILPASPLPAAQHGLQDGMSLSSVHNLVRQPRLLEELTNVFT